MLHFIPPWDPAFSTRANRRDQGMSVCLRFLLCVFTCSVALRASARETAHVTTRTLGQTGVHQFEIEFRAETDELDLLAPVGIDLSSIETPLPALQTHRLWMTTNDEGLRHLRFRLEAESPWVDALCMPTPDTLQGTAVPEPAALALVFALAAFGWVALRRHQQRLVVVRM